MLDSETTGLTPTVQFVEIAIVDASAKVLFEGTVRPVCRIEAGATRIHGRRAKADSYSRGCSLVLRNPCK